MQPHAVLRFTRSAHPPSKFPAQPIRRLTALSMAVLLLPMSQADLFAQQAPYYPGPPQPYSQYDPGQQYQQPYSQYDPGQQYQQPAPPPPDYGQPESGYQPDYGQPESGYQPGYGQPQALGPDQLEQLVAPIALNPDQLIALILAASTYPAQVQDADHWRQAQGNAPLDQIAYGTSLQAWDPSVKALTAFPQILAEMDANIQWTAALGNAYYNQPQDVLQAIQGLRQRAQAAGNLQSTPQEAVTDNQGYIQVAPANPQVVYVPSYDPWTVYGQPVTPYPGFSLLGAIGSFLSSGFGSSGVSFGVGTVLSAFTATPWGLLAWGLDWLGQNLLFHSDNYYTHSASVRDWGFRYGGPRARYAPRGAFAAYNRGYGRGYDRGYGQNYRSGVYNRGYQSEYRGYGQNQHVWDRNYPSYNRPGYGSNYNQAYRNGLYNRQQSAFANRSGYNAYNQNRSYQAFSHNNVLPARPQQYHPNAYGSNLRSGFNNGYSSPSRAGFGSNYAYNYGGHNYSTYNSGARAYNPGFAYRGNTFAGNGFANYGKSSRFGGFSGGNRNSFGSGFGHQQSFKQPHYSAPKMPKFHGGGGFGGGGHFSGGGGHHSNGGGHGGGGHSHGGGHHH